jgi:hypothetical protein
MTTGIWTKTEEVWVFQRQDGLFMRLEREAPATWSEWTAVIGEAAMFSSPNGDSHDHRWKDWVENAVPLKVVRETTFRW